MIPSTTTTDFVRIKATDGAGLTKTMGPITGDPSLTGLRPSMRGSEAVREQGALQGRIPTDEEEQAASQDLIDSPQARDFADFLLGIGAYAASPSVDGLCGVRALALRIEILGPTSAARVLSVARHALRRSTESR